MAMKKRATKKKATKKRATKKRASTAAGALRARSGERSNAVRLAEAGVLDLERVTEAEVALINKKLNDDDIETLISICGKLGIPKAREPFTMQLCF